MRIGIDLGGTKIEAVLMDAEGNVHTTLRQATPRGDYDGTVGAIARLVTALDAKAGDVCPVGLGTPGAWHAGRQAMKNCNSTWLNGRAFVPDVETAIERPVAIANDANCFALSEALDGAGGGAKTVFGVILGTGVGGGWVVDRSLLTGPNAIAGEWGHTPLPYFQSDARTVEGENRLDDRPCYCGRTNCVERFVSGPGLEQTDFELLARRRGVPELMSAADNDADARRVVDLYTTMLARALAQVINIVDPDVIVLGGGVSNMTSLYDDLPELIGRYAFTSEGETRVVPARHGDSSGVRGAARLNPP